MSGYTGYTGELETTLNRTDPAFREMLSDKIQAQLNADWQAFCRRNNSRRIQQMMAKMRKVDASIKAQIEPEGGNAPEHEFEFTIRLSDNGWIVT